jgi:hypothetical protein
MSMPMRLSLPVLAHETSMSMLMELSCARAHEACTRTTTLGKCASGFSEIHNIAQIK